MHLFVQSAYYIQLNMEVFKGKNSQMLCIKSITWYKDSHSLFDYESSKVVSTNFMFPLTAKAITIFRKRQSQTVLAKQSSEQGKFNSEEYQILARFQIQNNQNNKIKLIFSNNKKPLQKQIASDRVNTNQSIESVNQKQEETYLIVRKLKDANGQPKGYKLMSGQTIKLGRVQFYVSQICIDGQISMAPAKNKQKVYASRKVMKYQQKIQTVGQQKIQCKICLQETQQPGNFLFNPCKCSGSCGTVHLECLMQWIHFKVKKQVVGGTLHYNFEKFQCQVCKFQLPMVIDVNGDLKEMLPIQKPKGNYLILEGACEKSKSVMIIQNVALDGIKLGRGHQCQIRITDISVSRNHALIKHTNGPNGGFYIFDNKSKFGSLVREQDMTIQLGRQAYGVQIGRTVLSLDVRKEKQIKQQ